MARQRKQDRSSVPRTGKGCVQLKLTAKEMRALNALVKLAQDNLDGEGNGMRASPSSVLRALLIREAEDCEVWTSTAVPRLGKDGDVDVALAIRGSARQVAVDNALADREPFGWGVDLDEELPPWGLEPDVDMALLSECIEEQADSTTGLAFVPSIVRAMGTGVLGALHDGAQAGHWELLSGLGRISKNDARLCSDAPDGRPLAWVRAIEPPTESEVPTLAEGMTSGGVHEQTFFYQATLRTAWEQGDHSMLDGRKSKASPYIRDVLAAKAKERPKRFFGEAFIASRTEMKNGWYSSYQWLTADKWVTGNGLKKPFERDFYAALCKHLKRPLVERIQTIVRATGRMLVAPDLWMILRDGTHRFVEVKLDKDRVSPKQIDGLKILERALSEAGLPVSVVIANVVRGG
jgi:hypothetical protein